MGKHLASKAGIIFLASVTLSSPASSRSLDAATDFCTTVTIDPDLGRALGFVDNVSYNMSEWLGSMLRDALMSIDGVYRSPPKFQREPANVPACLAGNAILVSIRYSGQGRSDPITVRTQVRAPGRPIFETSHVFTEAQEIASGRVKLDSLRNTDELVITSSLKRESVSIARWILSGGKNAL